MAISSATLDSFNSSCWKHVTVTRKHLLRPWKGTSYHDDYFLFLTDHFIEIYSNNRSLLSSIVLAKLQEKLGREFLSKMIRIVKFVETNLRNKESIICWKCYCVFLHFFLFITISKLQWKAVKLFDIKLHYFALKLDEDNLSTSYSVTKLPTNWSSLRRIHIRWQILNCVCNFVLNKTNACFTNLQISLTLKFICFRYAKLITIQISHYMNSEVNFSTISLIHIAINVSN